ncbi:hypothetical protein NQ317_002950 [Molorchus minor]|uniref:Uncharacterized protein n=1 Tax=Molorchus minor TaxID=1323400 RepID=A0ABQ9IU41_9CUCU|nr:hypothetical protein NQ317_002950 [Molorchus minor]
MSHCRKLGPNNKDIVIFATKEDHQIPSKIVLPEAEPQPGLILPNGDINWNCSDCYDLFKDMQGCMQKYPTLYNKDLADDDELSSMDQAAKDPASKQDQTETSNTTPNK